MKNYKLHVSDGFKDVYGDTIIVTKKVEDIVLNTFTSFGYEMIKTPGLEYLDVYSLGGSQKPDLYNLINRHLKNARQKCNVNGKTDTQTKQTGHGT